MDDIKRKAINELTTERINNFSKRKKEVMEFMQKISEAFSGLHLPYYFDEDDYFAKFELSDSNYPEIHEFLKIYSHEIDTTGLTVDEIKDEVIKYLYRDLKRKGI